MCLFIFENNSPSRFSVWCNQRCSSKRPLRKFFSLPGVSHSITHARLSERISWEFYRSTPLYVKGSARLRLLFCSSLPSLLALSLRGVRSLWLRERLRASESIIYQSKELTGIIETITVGATSRSRKGTNKNTERLDWASAHPRSSCDFVPPPFALFWVNE